MSEPISPQNSAYPVVIKEGETYHWCSCGRSKSQPYCDGSHQGTDFQPVTFTAGITEVVYLCGCKKTRDAPICDGSHNR